MAVNQILVTTNLINDVTPGDVRGVKYLSKLKVSLLIVVCSSQLVRSVKQMPAGVLEVLQL